MNEYGITFEGRTKNALGVTYRITARRIAENEQAAVLALYDEFEHTGLADVRLVCENVIIDEGKAK